MLAWRKEGFIGTAYKCKANKVKLVNYLQLDRSKPKYLENWRTIFKKKQQQEFDPGNQPDSPALDEWEEIKNSFKPRYFKDPVGS